MSRLCLAAAEDDAELIHDIVERNGLPATSHEPLNRMTPLHFAARAGNVLAIVALEKLGADVIAISVDSPFAQEAWAKQAGIGLTLVSDFNRVALKAFKVKDTRVIPEKTGLLNVAKRSVFVADKAGNVIHSEVKRDPSWMPNFAKIKKAVEA